MNEDAIILIVILIIAVSAFFVAAMWNSGDLSRQEEEEHGN